MGICLASYSPYFSLKTPRLHIKKKYYAQETRKERKTTQKLSLSILFDKHHWSHIGILSAKKVKTNGKYNCGTVYHDVPVHRCQFDRGSEWEKGHDEEKGKKHDGDDVNPHAVFAQTPSGVGKGLALIPLENEAGERDNIGREERGNS